MHSSALLVAALAAGALAKPVKRDVVTDITYVTVTKYVTAGAFAEHAVATSASSSPYWAYVGGAHHSHSKQSTTEVTVTLAPTSTPAYTPSATPTPVSSEQAAATSASSGGSYESSDPNDYSARPTGSAQDTVSEPGAAYQAMVLWHHNQHRANHSAPALVWNSTLEQSAMEWAKKCQWQHNSAGQNLAAGGPNPNVNGAISDGWVNGEEAAFAGQYGLANPGGDFEAYGHFTQVVWAQSESVGCYTFNCEGTQEPGANVNNWMTVCNYYPAGNCAPLWAQNVLPAVSPALPAVYGSS